MILHSLALSSFRLDYPHFSEDPEHYFFATYIVTLAHLHMFIHTDMLLHNSTYAVVRLLLDPEPVVLDVGEVSDRQQLDTTSVSSQPPGPGQLQAS